MLPILPPNYLLNLPFSSFLPLWAFSVATGYFPYLLPFTHTTSLLPCSVCLTSLYKKSFQKTNLIITLPKVNKIHSLEAFIVFRINTQFLSRRFLRVFINWHLPNWHLFISYSTFKIPLRYQLPYEALPNQPLSPRSS